MRSWFRGFRGLSLGAAMAAALAAAPGAANAQGLALDRFDPAPAGDRMFGVQSPFVAGHLTPHFMLEADYARKPLVIASLKTGDQLGSVVRDQFFLHVGGGLALWNRLYVHVDVPVALAQGGDSPSGTGSAFASPDKAQMGDLRLGARVRLFGEYDDPFQIGLSGKLWFPTGPSGAFVGTGGVRGLPELVLGGRVVDRIVWSAAAGPQIAGSTNYAGIDQGSMWNWGLGAGVQLLDDRHLQLGAEMYGALTFKDVQKRTTNAELVFTGRYRIIDDVEIGAGVGPGLTSGMGTPAVRVVAMVAYTPEQKRPDDRDRDGIKDAEDACPDVPGVRSDDPKKNGCPIGDRDKDGVLDPDDACPDVPGLRSDDPKKNGCPGPGDRDHDGIKDADDACPDVPGVKSDDPAKNGCPLDAPVTKDRDGDGIFDDEDACPDIKGVRTRDPKTNGCPPDTDGDGIRDDKDACPNEKGPADPDPAKNGCPRSVRVTENEIFILEQVQFDTGAATIRKVSDPLLDEVAGVLKEHPEITKVEVQGHTDSKGNRSINTPLSKNRAAAVVKALTKRGIDARRLTSQGYGPDQPIASNDTEQGRQKNRRVQFKILEKKGKAK
jgi:outer membrane protein OmpA-like peptidoglycan-associated protein